MFTSRRPKPTFGCHRRLLLRAPKDAQPFFQSAQAIAAPYIKAGKWHTFTGSESIVDSMQLLPLAGQEKIDKWKKILGTAATSHAVVIEKFDGAFIELERSRIEVLKDLQGHTSENTMLWIPGQRILICGDVLFNGMHVYTAETDSKAREKWLNSLNKIRTLKPSVVIPGHSKVGAPLDASTAVDFTENYLLAFEEELKKAKDPDSFINTNEGKIPIRRPPPGTRTGREV
jgi:glyoxylase-like metal-dependent hydrolase (beta-lactamase superfamily II)